MPPLKSQCSQRKVAEPRRDLCQGSLVDNVAVDHDEEEARGEAGVGGQGDADRPDPEGGPQGADGEPGKRGGGRSVKISDAKNRKLQSSQLYKNGF